MMKFSFHAIWRTTTTAISFLFWLYSLWLLHCVTGEKWRKKIFIHYCIHVTKMITNTVAATAAATTTTVEWLYKQRATKIFHFFLFLFFRSVPFRSSQRSTATLVFFFGHKYIVEEITYTPQTNARPRNHLNKYLRLITILCINNEQKKKQKNNNAQFVQFTIVERAETTMFIIRIVGSNLQRKLDRCMRGDDVRLCVCVSVFVRNRNNHL